MRRFGFGWVDLLLIMARLVAPPRGKGNLRHGDVTRALGPPFSHAFLDRVARRIVNEVRGIIRVTCDITSKPPVTIEWFVAVMNAP